MKGFIKLVYIQNKLKAPKDSYNSFGGYKYRSAESILEAVKPLLKETNTVLLLSDDLADSEAGKTYVEAKAILIDAETGEEIATTKRFAREPESKKGMDDSQITGSASSYARKYRLNGLLAIDDTKDADTDEYVKQNATPKKKKEQNSSAKPAEQKDADEDVEKYYCPRT